MKVRNWTDKKIMKGAESLFLPGNKKTGILLFHGWSSSPQEFDPDYAPSTAKHLNNLGYPVYIPLRLGHGVDPQEFQGLHWEDWLRDANKHYETFSKEVDKVVIGGMSMGANLALHIASEKPVVGVIPMGTSIFMRMNGVFSIWAWLNRSNQKLRHKKYLPKDKEVAIKKIHYLQYPNYHLFENVKAARDTKKILGRVTAPALIMHSANDNVVHPRSAKYVYKHIGSSDKEIVLIKDSYHSFTTDRHSDVGNRAMEKFLGRIDR
ncbi:MAG: alpha/beta fold hydrolase [bacterium]|nr:alpha/beta fold hydrolase [bacterium]